MSIRTTSATRELTYAELDEVTGGGALWLAAGIALGALLCKAAGDGTSIPREEKETNGKV